MPRTTEDLLAMARQSMPSGNYLPIRARKRATRVLIVAVEHDAPELESLADELTWIQIDRPFVKPILLLNTPDVAAVRKRGFVYETAVDASTWLAVDPGGDSYRSYLQQRVIEMANVYEPHYTVVAEPGKALPAWPFSRLITN